MKNKATKGNKRLEGKGVFKSKKTKKNKKLKLLTLARVPCDLCRVREVHSSHPRPSHRDEHGCTVGVLVGDPPVCS